MEAVAALSDDIEVDDKAYTLARLARVGEARGETYVPDCANLAQAAFDQHKAFQIELEQKLDQLVSNLSAAPEKKSPAK